MKKQITLIVLIVILALGYNYFKSDEDLEDLNVGGDSDLIIGGQTYFLNQSLSSSATSVELSSFTIPQSGLKINSTHIGDIEYATIEPGNSSRQEFISFTGITQNADGTATLNGVARGLEPVSPYTASTTFQFAHAGGVRFIISDSPSKWDRVSLKNNDETITGLWTFNTVLPTSNKTATTSEQFTTKTYVDSVANAGAATSTETNGGIVELATQIEQASTTDDGTGNKPLVLYAKYSTSTPDGTSQAGLHTPISKNNGKLHQLWLDLTEVFTWAGAHIFNSTVDIEADSAAKLTLNGISYAFPSTENATSSVMKTDGSGNLIWDYPTIRQFAVTLQDVVSSSASTTVVSAVIPASSLIDGDIIIMDGMALAKNAKGSAGAVKIDLGFGGTSTTTLNLSESWGNISTEKFVSFTLKLYRVGNDLYMSDWARMGTNDQVPFSILGKDVTSLGGNMVKMTNPGFTTQKNLDLEFKLDASDASFYFKPQAVKVYRIR